MELLNIKRDRAKRIRMARGKKCEALEQYKRKYELEDMADHLKDVLVTRLFDMLSKETNIALMNTELLSAKASIVEGVEVPMDIVLSKGWLEMEILEHEAMEQLMINLMITRSWEVCMMMKCW